MRFFGQPCNQFGGQEPGDNDEIVNCVEYVRPGHGYKIPSVMTLSQKGDVNGLFETPLFKGLKASCGGGDVGWNFVSLGFGARRGWCGGGCATACGPHAGPRLWLPGLFFCVFAPSPVFPLAWLQEAWTINKQGVPITRYATGFDGNVGPVGLIAEITALLGA